MLNDPPFPVLGAAADPVLRQVQLSDGPKLDVTDWYTADQLPAEDHTGVYQIEVPKGVDPMFRYWSGTQWYYGGHTPAEAMRAYQMLGIVIEPDQYRPWRGLDKWAGVPEIA